MCRLILTAGLYLIVAIIASGGDSQQFCIGKTDGDYANPNNLNSFYSCSNGVVYIKYCQPGLIFNESCDCCDWPPTAAPTATDQSVNTTKSPEPSQNVCNGKSDGDYANPNDLNSFYSCSNGVVYIKYCQPGLIFNESCDCCDWPPTAAPSATDQSVNTTKSPEPSQNVCNGKSDGDYANPNDLNSFYSCSNGVVYIKYCQPGLIFNESCDCCDWPPTAAPSATDQSVNTTKSPEPSQNVCNGKSDGDYANPNDLNSFYSCSNGVVYIKYCQPGLIFNESCDCCDWPPTAAPTATDQSVNTTKSPEPSQNVCNGKSDGDYANPNDLNSFYSCSNGVVYIKYCQPGLIFNKSCNCCDWPPTAAPTATDQSVNTTKSPEPSQNVCNGKSDGDYANPNDLNSFYSCSNGVAYIKYCQPGLIFNESCNCCDWPPTAAPTTTTPRVTTTKSPAPCQHFCSGKRNGYYANPNNLNSFYSCSNGVAYIKYCQPGLIFNESCDCCDWPPTPAPTATDQSVNTTKSPEPSQNVCNGKSDGDYANPNDLNSFYSCSNGVVYIKYCQPGLIFNESCDCCDWPPTAAPSATDQSVNTTKSPEPSQNVCNGKSDGDYANPNDLNSFYSCSNGVVYIKYCQPGLIFNESCDCCDWPPTAAPSATDQSVNTTKSPEPSQNVCNGKSDGDYANPNDLNSFYSCSNGVVYIKYCQPGLIFNESCDCCDWPPTAAPSATDQSVNTTKSPEPSQNVCNGKSDGDYANPNDLNSFYSCSNGVVYIKYCQPGLIFNKSCNCCDWPPTAAPTATDQSVNTTKSPEPSQNVCNGKSDGDYANPNDLNSFYSCSNGVAYIKYCQPGLIFNESCNCCDSPTTAAPTTTTQRVTKTKSPAPCQHFCSGKRNGYYANPNNLNSFYSCSNGVAYIKYCQPGLIFNESCNCCDSPTTAAPTTTTQRVTKTKSPAPCQHFCSGKRNGYYANPNNLNSFYSCSNGVVYIKYCQPGLIFNESCNCCDSPTTAAPTTTTQRVTKTKSPAPCQHFCSGKRNGYYANPNNLNSFYSCSNGVVYIKYCQPGLIFNESCNCCDWPPTAAPTTTTPRVTTTKSPAPCQHFCSGKRDGYYANPNNLNSFYSCSNGVVYIKYCQPGLIFNESCNCCDWPTTAAPTTTTQRVTKTKSPAPCQHFCSGKRNGYYANPKNPYLYFRCSNGVVYIKYCQPGLIFNESCNCCDWPTTAAPTTTTQRVTKTKSPAPCQHFCSGKRNGYYANPKNPYLYFRCSKGRTYIGNCQPGFIFKESCNCCDWVTAPTTTINTDNRTTTAESKQDSNNTKNNGDYVKVNSVMFMVCHFFIFFFKSLY